MKFFHRAVVGRLVTPLCEATTTCPCLKCSTITQTTTKMRPMSLLVEPLSTIITPQTHVKSRSRIALFSSTVTRTTMRPRGKSWATWAKCTSITRQIAARKLRKAPLSSRSARSDSTIVLDWQLVQSIPLIIISISSDNRVKLAQESMPRPWLKWHQRSLQSCETQST